MKKRLSVLLVLLLIVSVFAACNGQEAPAPSPSPEASPTPGEVTAEPPSESEVNFPTGPVTFIIPWSPGGGSDLGGRIIQPHLEAYLGVPVVVTNPTGGTGWIGWEQMLAADADGYTVSMVNFPALFGGYLDPTLGRDRDLSDFQFVANHVSDKMLLVARADDDRFLTPEDFVAYAADNGITFGTTGVGTQGHMSFEVIRQIKDLDMTMIPFNGASDVLGALMGGHIDVGTISVGEALTPIANGEIHAFVLLADENSVFLPEIPTWNGAFPDHPHTMSSQRGFALSAGTDPAIVDIWASAFEYAINHPDAVERMAELGLFVDFMSADEYLETILAFEALVIDLREFMGW